MGYGVWDLRFEISVGSYEIPQNIEIFPGGEESKDALM